MITAEPLPSWLVPTTLYSYVYPELRNDVIQIGKGKNVNYETVLTTDADLAILPQRFAYMVEEFAAIGIPAIVILTSKESYDTIRNALTLVGQVTGEEDRAAEIIAYFDGVINKLNERTASVTEKPSVMFLGSSNMYSYDKLLADINGLYELLYGQTFTAEQIGIVK